MIAEKILGKLGDTDKITDTVKIEWYERGKKVLRKVTQSGEEIGIRVDQPLNDGDILYEDEKRIIVAEIAECDLISINIKSISEAGRLCFELGNRHLSVYISDTCIKCPFDEPTYEYLRKLGFPAEKTFEKFSGYIECKAHAHSGTHGNHEHHHE